MSLTLHFFVGILYFVLDWRFNNTSFLHLFQNSLQICWNLLQWFLQYLSGDAKTTGGGITIFDFIARRFIGRSGIRLKTLLILSVVNGREFTRVCNDSSVRLPPWVFNKELRIILELPICLSQHPPVLPANGGLRFQLVHSPTMFFQIVTDSWMIHFLKCLNQLCWSPSKVWSIAGSYQANISSSTNESS